MSLGIALGNATSGLAANSRMAGVVAANLANALTDGYGRRSVELSPVSLGGDGRGVRVDGVARMVDRGLLIERRAAESALGERRALGAALRGLEGELGAPPGGSALSARLAAFEAALVSAAADPSSEARLGDALNRLQDVAGALNDAGSAVQRRRAEADATIARQASELDAALGGVARLNRDVALARAEGRDAAGLLDQRQALVDKVAALVPVREREGPNGSVTLMAGGTALVEGSRAVRVGFAATPVITADMTLAAGGLGGLTLDGRPAGADGVGALAGGPLGAAFSLRDAVLPEQGRTLDALARDLVERLEGADATRAPGAPGLLTDAGAAFDPTRATGLAGRLAVNAAADPARGGAAWRLRDGLGATAPGPAGESAQLLRLLDALDAPRALATGGRAGGAAALAADLSADLATRRLAAERDEGFAAARWSSLREAELAGGVNSDAEMQLMLRIEQAYAANARVVEAIDGMMRRILEI